MKLIHSLLISAAILRCEKEPEGSKAPEGAFENRLQEEAVDPGFSEPDGQKHENEQNTDANRCPASAGGQATHSAMISEETKDRVRSLWEEVDGSQKLPYHTSMFSQGPSGTCQWATVYWLTLKVWQENIDDDIPALIPKWVNAGLEPGLHLKSGDYPGLERGEERGYRALLAMVEHSLGILREVLKNPDISTRQMMDAVEKHGKPCMNGVTEALQSLLAPAGFQAVDIFRNQTGPQRVMALIDGISKDPTWDNNSGSVDEWARRRNFVGPESSEFRVVVPGEFLKSGRDLAVTDSGGNPVYGTLSQENFRIMNECYIMLECDLPVTAKNFSIPAYFLRAHVSKLSDSARKSLETSF